MYFNVLLFFGHNRLLRSLNTREETSEVVVKVVFSKVLLPGTRRSRAKRSILRLCDCLVLLAGKFEYTKTSLESFLAVLDCSLVHPTPSHIPEGAWSNLAGWGCLLGAVAVRK